MTDDGVDEQLESFDLGKLGCGWILFTEDDEFLCSVDGIGNLECDYSSCPILMEVLYCGKHRKKKK